MAATLADADSLTPYGVEVRYPSDAPELLPGEEEDAVQTARRVRDELLTLLTPYLSAR